MIRIDHQRQVFFIRLIHRKRNELKRLCFGLTKEGKRFRKAEIAPVFTKGEFHIFNQQVKILYIPADRASHDQCCIRVWHRAAHCRRELASR